MAGTGDPKILSIGICCGGALLLSQGVIGPTTETVTDLTGSAEGY